MGSTLKKRSSNSVEFASWLETAEAHIDPTHKRGDVCRGAYIVSREDNRFYLNHRGEWTNGIEGDENFWEDKSHAQAHLYSMRQSNATDHAE